jgi:hypothetical protein
MCQIANLRHGACARLSLLVLWCNPFLSSLFSFRSLNTTKDVHNHFHYIQSGAHSSAIVNGFNSNSIGPACALVASTSIEAEIQKLEDYTKHFIPRHTEAIARLFPNDQVTSPQIVVIHGGRGTGKTASCRDVARKYCDL